MATDRRQLKVEVYEQIARISKAAAAPKRLDLLDLLSRVPRTLAKSRLAEVDRVAREYCAHRGALEAVERDELVRRVRSSEVTVLDVRPIEEFRAGHIPGARSIPVSELSARLQEIPKDRDVVACCRGTYCVMAVEAAELLRRKGFAAHRMEHGVADWRARGWRIEQAAPGKRVRHGARSKP
jgi:rhodanese-related sulfurtransferase